MFEIQAVDTAFASRIPEHLWHTVGRAKTPRGAYRHYAREWGYRHPQQNAWSGHVRILLDGRPVTVEKDYLEVHYLD